MKYSSNNIRNKFFRRAALPLLLAAFSLTNVSLTQAQEAPKEEDFFKIVSGEQEYIIVAENGEEGSPL